MAAPGRARGRRVYSDPQAAGADRATDPAGEPASVRECPARAGSVTGSAIAPEIGPAPPGCATMRAVSPRTALAFALVLAAGSVAAACTSSSPTPPPSGSAGAAAPASTPAAPTAAPHPGGEPAGSSSAAPAPAGADTIATGQGDLTITPVYHATVMLQHGGHVIVADPWSKGPIDRLPKADLLLITDVHHDHFDKEAIARLKKDGTIIVAPPAVASDLPGAKALKNGERTTVLGVEIEAVPMYNKVRGPDAGKLYHDKGRGNGYVLTIAGKRIYLSGDTECTDEMKALRDIDVAFVCMNLPYTMPSSEAAACIEAFKPKIVYPYHFRDSNLAELTKALEGDKAIEVRLRTWY